MLRRQMAAHHLVLVVLERALHSMMLGETAVGKKRSCARDGGACISACYQARLTCAASGGFGRARVGGQGRATTRDGILAAVPSALRCCFKEVDKPGLAVLHAQTLPVFLTLHGSVCELQGKTHSQRMGFAAPVRMQLIGTEA